MSNENPPKIELADPEPLQDIFVDQDGNEFSVARLVDAAKSYPVFNAPLACINLNQKAFDEYNIIEIAFHIKKVLDADLGMPIIFNWSGSLADGRHRVIKAIVEGKSTIKAVRIGHYMAPCKEGS